MSQSSNSSDIHSQAHPQLPKKSWLDATKAYLDHRVLFLLFLGFVAGLPFMLIYSSLSLWLTEAGIDRAEVTMFSWAMLGYSFKFIWAPMIDALQVPVLGKWLGRRRGWMLTSQLGIILALILIASTDPKSAPIMLTIMAIGAVLLGFSSATQDIALDAYRIEVAPASMQPILSSIYIIGYRIGMIASGAGALYLAEYLGSTSESYSYDAWKWTYLSMILLVGVGILTTLTIYEPSTQRQGRQARKQRINQRIMGIYSAIVLIPSVLYGLWYLLNKIAVNIFSSHLFNIPEFITTKMVIFWLITSLLIPVALLFLLFNQPRFNYLNEVVLTPEGKKYLRLTALFFISVIGFVASFWGIGNVMPTVDSKFLAFFLQVIKLAISLGVMSAIGYSLVSAGLVDKSLAKRTWVNPFMDFFRRYGKQAMLLLMLIGFYRVSDLVAGNISNIFYEDMGFSKTDIANAVKLVGMIMAISGGFLGGLLTQKMSLMKAMMLGAVLASSTNLLFILLTFHPGDLTYMYMAVILDNLAAGLASAIFIAFLSALTSIKFTAVQYAIFSSLMTLFPKVLGGYSGGIVNEVGYPIFFTFTFAIGIPILLLIYLVDKNIMIGENDDTGTPTNDG